MGCKVKKILTPNGQPSKVFNEISSVYGAEVGLVAYLHMHSDAFLNSNRGQAVDENGEYDWRFVLESLNKGENAVNRIIEKSVGVRKATGRLTSYRAENAQEKIEILNTAFSNDNMPFIAKIETLPDGTTNIYIEIMSKTNLNPVEKNDLDPNVDDEYEGDLDFLQFQDEDEYSDDNWVDDYANLAMEEDEDFDDVDMNDMDISGDFLSGDIDSILLSDSLNESINDLVTAKREKPIKLAHRFKSILKSIALQKKNLQQRLGRVEDNIKRELANKNEEKVSNLRKKASSFRVEINHLEKLDAQVLEMKSLDQVTAIVDREINNATKRLKNAKDMDILELQGIKRQLEFWSEAGVFRDNKKHILFNKQDLDSEPMKKLFRAYKNKADDQLVKVHAELTNRFEQFLKEKLGANADLSKAMQMANDVNFAQAQMLDISRMDNMILQAIFKGVNHAKQRAKMDTDKIVSKIDEMMPKVLEEAKKLNKSSNPFDIFIQTDKEGKRTGDAVTAISIDYEREKDINFRNVTKNKKSTPKDKAKAYKWLRENEIFFDWRKIYFDHKKNVVNSKGKPFTQADKDEHIAELKKQFGEEVVNDELAKMEAKLFEFEVDYHTKVEEVFGAMEDEGNGKADTHGLKIWEIQHSPFYASRNAANGTPNTYGGKIVPSNGKRFILSLPKKTINGKSTTHYDKKYEQIQSNPVLKEFHEYYTETMQKLNLMLPHSKRYQLKHNSIVFTEKTIKEMIWSGEIGVDTSSVETFANIAKESIRTTDYGTTASNAFDPATGEAIREVSANFVNDGKKELFQIVNVKALVWQGKNKGVEASEAMKRQWRYEALNELAMKKSYDLGHVLKNYALLANAYRHKAAVEDKVHLSYEMFKQMQEGITNAKGDSIKDEYGDEQSKDGLVNMQKALNHFMDNFDNFKQKEEIVSKIDVQTKKEKEDIQRIDDAIKSLDNMYDKQQIPKKKYEEVKSELILQKESIGGKLSLTKVGEGVLWMAQIKGMGFNAPASFVNFVFGQLSNIIEGASQRFFKEGAIWSATKTIMGNKKARKKAILMAKKYDILSDNLDIITGTSNKKFFGRHNNYVTPYGWTTMAEEINQSPIVLAALREEMLTVNGKQISLWDATDENGNLLPEYATEETIAQYEGDNANPEENIKLHEFTSRTKQIIKKVHGNYDPNSPVLAKRTVFGKAMLQFRSWLAESVTARFEGEKVDYITGTTRKGRYRTLWETKNEEGNLITGFSLRIRQVEALLKAAIPFLKLKAGPKGFTLSRTDMENMRELAKELQITLGLLFVGAMALIAREGGDDDSWEKWAATLFANNTARVSKDLAAFMSPTWPLEFIQKPVAAIGLVDDLRDIEVAMFKLFSGDTEISTGINAGMNRFYKESIELFPVTNQIFKVDKMGKKLFAEPYSSHGLMATAIDEWLNNGR